MSNYTDDWHGQEAREEAMTARVEAERAIADVLLAHRHNLGVCTCGLGEERTFGIDPTAHRAHVASVLADLMAERQAEAWACDCGGTVTSEVWLRCSNPGCQSNHFVVSTYWRPSPDPKDTRDE